MSQPSTYQVNQSREGGFDIELNSVNATTNPSASVVKDDMIIPEGNDNFTIVTLATTDIDAGAATIDEDSSSSILSKYASLFSNKTAAAIATVALVSASAVFVFGASIEGDVEHNQQQMALSFISSILNTVYSYPTTSALFAAIPGASKSKKKKAGKGKSSASFCEPVPAITCGASFTDETIVLSDDLICTDDLQNGISDDEKRTLNAAIEVIGPKASIDCKGHTISQVLVGTAVRGCDTGFDEPPYVTRDPSDDRKDMKEDCNIFYQGGILLRDGATAINCKVEHFYDGIIVLDGEVKKSEVSGNRRGVFIDHRIGSIATETKISDV